MASGKQFETHRHVEWGGVALCAFFAIGVLAGTTAITVFAKPPEGDGATSLVVLWILAIVLFLGIVAGGVYALRGFLFPCRLVVKNDAICYYEGKKLKGEVPFRNIVEIKARWEEQAPNAMAFGGGLVGALAALRAAERKPTTIVIRLRDADDRHTSWPEQMIKKKTIRIKVEWKLPCDAIAKKLENMWLEWKRYST